MPGCCVAFGCRSGYRSCTGYTPDGRKLTFHSFPLSNYELSDKWVRALHRVDFTPTKYSRVCSRHFTDADFITARRDSNQSRCRKKQSDGTGGLVSRHLTSDAVPSVFENVPAYMSAVESTPRQTNLGSASRRRENEV